MKKKILIVEDNLQNKKLFKDLLEVADFDVLEAGDAKEGMAIANKHPLDLIIIDFQLPEMNGLELAKVLSENPKTEDIPCVFVTASVVGEKK